MNKIKQSLEEFLLNIDDLNAVKKDIVEDIKKSPNPLDRDLLRYVDEKEKDENFQTVFNLIIAEAVVTTTLAIMLDQSYPFNEEIEELFQLSQSPEKKLVRFKKKVVDRTLADSQNLKQISKQSDAVLKERINFYLTL